MIITIDIDGRQWVHESDSDTELALQKLRVRELLQAVEAYAVLAVSEMLPKEAS